MPAPVPEYPSLTAEQEAVRARCEAFLATQADASEGWQELQGNRGRRDRLAIHLLNDATRAGRGVLTVRGRLFFAGVKPAAVLDLLLDLSGRARWDSQLTEARVAATVAGGAADIAHLCYAGVPAIVSPRDLCLLRCWDRRPDGSCALVAESVADAAVPESPDAVRAELWECGYLMRPRDGGCDVVYISSLDFKGQVPKAFTNVVMRQQPRSLEAMRKLLGGPVPPDPACALM